MLPLKAGRDQSGRARPGSPKRVLPVADKNTWFCFPGLAISTASP
jgi:hypothetical protein